MSEAITAESDDWYAAPVEDVYDAHETDGRGLSSDDAESRLEEYGPNRLPRAARTPAWRIVARQFKDPLIYVLIVAGVVSLAIGEQLDAAFITAVLAINAVIGSLQEWQAEKSTRALQELIEERATVVRDGETRDIDSDAVVPGDVVRLESGDRVPADVRLTATADLRIDEAPLTGESEPVAKDENWEATAETSLGDRRNMAYAGTSVARGRGTGVVVDTGTNTKIGQLAADVTTLEGERPPLVTRMERFTRVIGVAVLVAAALIAVLGVVVHEYDVLVMFLFAVALAVSAIPEGLPVGMTVALGVASRRMADVGVIVRQMVAVEGLGSCTMIASDKTGTLTANELTVTQIRLADGTTYDVTGEGYEPDGTVRENGEEVDVEAHDHLDRIARAAVLCNEGTLALRNDEWSWRGDPTDIALLSLGRKLGWTSAEAREEYPQVGEIPFESEQRYAATFHRADETVRLFVKGAPERVLEMCEDARPDASLTALEAEAEAMAKEGYRVLAVAERTLEERVDTEGPPDEPDELTFLGFLGLMDPLRSGAEEAVADARKAGVTVTMITGDHPETALTIARELGLAEERDDVITGAELADVSGGELQEILEDTRVFARVSPSQKLAIVEAAGDAGHYVAVTGDGVNDAPALRQANIGIAMGQMGTDVARDESELVLSDDNFVSIVDGIREGRIAYDNIRKIVYLLVSTGAAEVVLIMLAILAGLPLPLTPVQILWLNLVTNGIQDVALAFEPEENDVLDRPPRSPTERVFDRLMVERTVIGALVMGPLAFVVFVWLLGAGLPETAARNHILLLMVMFEIVNVGNARSETVSLFRLSPLASPILLTGTIIAFLVHVAAMHLEPLRSLLEAAPVSPGVWLGLAAVALAVAAAIELHKVWWSRRSQRAV
ncbi:P-type ATPase, translocating [Halovivax ruber XH-70]|uniref:P-type ATPase, translocating n=1 Tax=Halovivax ruber (strain DSM 18193 / JCM 13892 / XH-70) TaxID=797302 RepID=L0IHS0_HALRX|nr:HAD-IC family P-type ATPase [Halovivax ruber]AGB17537.1 P-type ATPase, translocating [Halovivax ruber XH-70]